MKIAQQIRARREQLGVTVPELANRVGVSAQAIRYWESGRSAPGKSKVPQLESALSFTIDWAEGARAASMQPQMASLIAQGDIDLLLLLCRLPQPFKDSLAGLARMHLDAIVGVSKKAFSGRAVEDPGGSFKQRDHEQPAGSGKGAKAQRSSTAAKASKRGGR